MLFRSAERVRELSAHPGQKREDGGVRFTKTSDFTPSPCPLPSREGGHFFRQSRQIVCLFSVQRSQVFDMTFKNALHNFSFDRLRNLPPRDRWLLIGGGAGLLLVIYLSLWLPLQRELSRLRVSVPQEKVQLAQMQVQALEINQLRASGRMPQAGGNLLVNLEQSATANGIRSRIIRMEPEGTGGARLSLEGVHFNALIGWLANLQNQGGVRIEKATFEAQPAAGTVNARLVLRSAGG